MELLIWCTHAVPLHVSAKMLCGGQGMDDLGYPAADTATFLFKIIQVGWVKPCTAVMRSPSAALCLRKEPQSK